MILLTTLNKLLILSNDLLVKNIFIVPFRVADLPELKCNLWIFFT
jgi:hypothetical protein